MSAVAEMRRVRVDLAGRGYDILIGGGLLERAGEHIMPLLGKQRRAIIVTDENVARHQLPRLERGLAASGITSHVFAVPAGEASKSFAELERLLDRLLGFGIERGSLLLALGGGVVGDLAGFAAAIALRGIDYVQIPTSLLAQLDSSVGGKTAINAGAGKNLVGAFHQPRLVLADIDTLATLPERERRAGYAEEAKHAAISDRDFFAWLERHGASVIAGDTGAQIAAIEHSCRTKARIVAADEREGGVRALLNFGHTFGHALEAETGFSDALLHGESVALGMVLASDLSVLLGRCPREDRDRLVAHLAGVGLTTRLADVPGAPFEPDRLIAHMAHDKKVRDGALTFILLDGIGAASIVPEVPISHLRAVLRSAA
jgi:3-dehydroquinate synthase